MYQGKEGQWAFMLHRLSGLAILFYLLLHVCSISANAISRELYEQVHHIYDMAPFRIGLIFVTAGVLYHSLNGLRIICMDFFGWGVKFQRELWYMVMGLTAVGGLLTAIVVIPRILQGV